MKFDGTISRGGEAPPCIGLIPSVLPEVLNNHVAKNSQTGVSTKNALSETFSKSSKEGNKDK